MIKALIPERAFNLPASYFRRLYGLGAVGAAVFVVVLPMFSKASTLDAAALVALVGVPFLLIYPLVGLRAFVWLSGAGIQGKGTFGGRSDLLEWSEPVVLEEEWPRRGPRGFNVFRFDGNHRKRLRPTLFIPGPILRDSRFREALARVAPKDHPLVVQSQMPSSWWQSVGF